MKASASRRCARPSASVVASPAISMFDFSSRPRRRARSLSLPISTIRNRHSHIVDAITAHNANGDLFPDPIFHQQFQQILGRLDRMAIESHDDIADQQASLLRWAAPFDADNQQGMFGLFGAPLALGQPHRLAGYPEVAAADAAMFEKRGRGFPGNR